MMSAVINGSGSTQAAHRPTPLTGLPNCRPSGPPTTAEFAECRHLFNCLVCLDPFTSPRVLDCQHVFCEPCLEFYRALYRRVRFETGSPESPSSVETASTSTTPIPVEVVGSGPFPCPICRRSTLTPTPLLSVTTGGCTAVERLQSIRHRKLSRGASEVSLRCDACIGASTSSLTNPNYATNNNNASLVQGRYSPAAVEPTGPPTPTDVNSPATNGRLQLASADETHHVSNGNGIQPTNDPSSAVGSAASSRSVSVTSRSATLSFDDAEFHCAKCAMNFCKNCRVLHDAQPLFKGHVIVHVSGYETIELYCAIHGTGSRRPCGFYCLDCDRPACVVCVLHDDAGHRTVKIRDAVASRRDVLKTLLNAFGPRLDRLETRHKQLCEMYAERRRGRQSAPPTASRSGWMSAGPMKDSMESTIFSFTSGFQSKSARRRRTGLLAGWYPGGPPPYSAICPQSSVSSNHNAVTSSGFMKRSPSGGVLRHVGEEREECEEREDDERQRRLAMSGGGLDGKDGSESNSSSLSSISGDNDTSFPAVTTQARRLQKLFDRATKVLEISDMKKLLAVYEDLVSRIQTVLEVELPVLQSDLDDRLSCELARQQDCSSAAADTAVKSLTLNGHRQATPGTEGVNFSHKHSHSEGKLHKTATETTGTTMSLLVRPKLIWKVEKQRSDIGEMCNPCDVTFLPDESAVVVAEYDSVNDHNNKLQLFQRDTGNLLPNLAQGQIQPLGVAATRDGQHLAVTDCRGKRVRLLTVATGQTVADIGKGQFGWPYGIATTSRGQLVVTDAFNDSVSVYSPDGKRLRTFGSSGSGSSQFRNPYHVAVDARDNILVSDSGNDCIKVFDISGRFIYCASEAARRMSVDVLALQPADRKQQQMAKRRKLKAPRGISVDPRHGHVIVADDRSRVCMFDSGGRYVRNLLTDEDSVKFPEAVHCSRSGLLAVTEWNPNNMFAVKLFNLYE